MISLKYFKNKGPDLAQCHKRWPGKCKVMSSILSIKKTKTLKLKKNVKYLCSENTVSIPHCLEEQRENSEA